MSAKSKYLITVILLSLLGINLNYNNCFSQHWKPISGSRYQTNPLIFTINNKAVCDKIREITQVEISSILGGSRIDIMVFNLEKRRGIEKGDIMQFYSPAGVIGYTHTITSSDINAGLQKQIEIAERRNYLKLRYDDKPVDSDLKHLVGMLRTMHTFWTIDGPESFSISMRNGKVEFAHNIPIDIKCTEMVTPEITIYFNRDPEDNTVQEILIPQSLRKTRLDNWIIRFKDFSSITSSERQRAGAQNLTNYFEKGVEPDTIGILFSDKDEARQVHLANTAKVELLGKSFVVVEENQDRGVLTDAELDNLRNGLLSPNYFFNVNQYNPAGIGVNVFYEEGTFEIEETSLHEKSGNNLLGKADESFLLWCRTKQQPVEDPGRTITDNLTIGIEQTREGILLTYLDWLDSDFNIPEKYLDRGEIPTTIDFQRMSSRDGSYHKLKRQPKNTIYREGAKIIRMELDEKTISKSIGSSRDAYLHFNVKNEEYTGEPLLFLNDAEKSGKKIWESPPPIANSERWKNGYYYPVDNKVVLKDTLLLEPNFTFINENGGNINMFDYNNLDNPNNRRWLVLNKEPKYDLLIAAGGFCSIVVISLLMTQ
ncbi:MAG: hypothetical protein HQ591_08805 [candidate division Zixibacteria bacterium]|nr:hypothetical protein [Candidatus Tariuqbacter arcticus]